MKLRKGFTLVELLIVIIIIGILAAAMLLSSGSATASAEASNIITGLRSLKSASLLWWSDNLDATTVPAIAQLDQYMDNPGKLVGYSFTSHTDGAWWVFCTMTTANVSSGVAEVGRKLTGKRTSIGLYIAPVARNTMITNPGDYAGAAVVYMIAR